MLMLIICVIACIVIGVLSHRLTKPNSGYYTELKIGQWIGNSLIPLYIYVFVALMASGASYSDYISLRTTYDGIVEQYRDAVDLYGEKAIAIDAQKAFALTDFGHQGYQAAMSSFIKDLRETVTTYNRILIKKRILGKNIFFGWYITEPDPDMKILQLRTKKLTD